MESHELRIFRAVAYEGSISKAAQALGYVQSNITTRVQQLEARLQTQLFYRQRGMILTPAGEKLLGYADRVIQLLDEAELALHDAAEPSGRLVLGAHPTVSARHLPQLLAEYNKAFPKVELSLVTSVSDELVQKVRQYQLDGAFIKAAVQDDKIVAELIYEEELVLITQPGKEDLQSIGQQPFLMNTIGCPHRDVLEEWLKSVGNRSVRYLEFNHQDAIIQGVVAGLGASVVPKSAVQKQVESGELQAISVPSQAFWTKTYFIRHKEVYMTRALEEFLELLRKSSLYQNRY